MKAVSWAVAFTRCASLGSSLATIHSGAWHDGSPLDFTAWDAGQPNDEFGAEDCAHMGEIGATWNDHVCEEVHAFVCRGVP